MEYNEHNEQTKGNKLETIIEIIAEKPKIENNPFSDIPVTQLKKALKLLEEYGEEHTFKGS